MKRKKPKLSYLENAKFSDNIEYIGLEISDNPSKHMLIDGITFDSCIFNRIDFSNITLRNVSFLDCIFFECDLANKEFDHIFIIRTEFKSSRLTGINISHSKLQDVLFLNTNMHYSLFADCNIENTEFINCILSASRFYGLKLRDTVFEQSVMHDFEVISTPLKGIDFSSDDITSLLVDIDDIRGIKVSMSQAINLLELLEIEVK